MNSTGGNKAVDKHILERALALDSFLGLEL